MTASLVVAGAWAAVSIIVALAIGRAMRLSKQAQAILWRCPDDVQALFDEVGR